MLVVGLVFMLCMCEIVMFEEKLNWVFKKSFSFLGGDFISRLSGVGVVDVLVCVLCVMSVVESSLLFDVFDFVGMLFKIVLMLVSVGLNIFLF